MLWETVNGHCFSIHGNRTRRISPSILKEDEWSRGNDGSHMTLIIPDRYYPTTPKIIIIPWHLWNMGNSWPISKHKQQHVQTSNIYWINRCFLILGKSISFDTVTPSNKLARQSPEKHLAINCRKSWFCAANWRFLLLPTNPENLRFLQNQGVPTTKVTVTKHQSTLTSQSHRIHGAAIHGNIYHPYTPVMLAYIPAPWILWELPNPQQTFTKTVAKSTASRRKTCSSSSPSPHWERHRHCNASGPATLPSFSLFFRMKKRWAKCQTFNWEIHKSTFSMDLLEGKFIYENYGAPYAFCIYPKGLFSSGMPRNQGSSLLTSRDGSWIHRIGSNFQSLKFCTIQCRWRILIHTCDRFTLW